MGRLCHQLRVEELYLWAFASVSGLQARCGPPQLISYSVDSVTAACPCTDDASKSPQDVNVHMKHLKVRNMNRKLGHPLEHYSSSASACLHRED